ncbi:MAG TPA: hypothetical protein VKF42_01895 [Chitinivibrionales bacterium]|nr:hypothetical protein [Chitinivibrionales bacterium]
MKYCLRIIFGMTFVIVSASSQAYSVSPPTDVSSLATAKGYLIAGTFSGKIFASPDSGISWSDMSFGLCDSSSITYQKTIKCLKVTRDDTIHAITACGEFVAVVPDLHWKQISNDSCVFEYCSGCLTANTYYTALGRWMIKAFITGPIEWSPDSGKTWTIAVPGCSVCSMPIVTSLYFDTISALAGLYNGYGSTIGYSSGMLISTDSGRTWHATGFAPVYQGVRSITRIGSIAFAGTENGIYASRDNFTTRWLLGESSFVKKPGLSVSCESVVSDRGVRRFTLTGRLVRLGERTYGNQVVIEVRPDGTIRYSTSTKK